MNERKGFLLFSMAVLAFIAFLMVRPFLGYLFGAALLAFILHPLQKRFSPRIGGKISAFALVILGVVVVVVPFLLAASAVIEDARTLSNDVNTTDLVNTTEIENQIRELTGRSIDVEGTINETVGNFTEYTFGSFSEVLGIVADVSLGVSLMLFILYYLLKDGKAAVKWTKEVTPLPMEIQDSLYDRINVTTWAVIKGHVLIAVIQGLVAGAALAVTGVPNYAFWTFIMVLLGFIPIIGTAVVWIPASIYMYIIGRPLAAIFIMLYGAVIVGLTDNIIRPLVVDRAANLHPAVVIIGVIGGVYLFGAAGLFIGPIILGILKSVVLVFKNNYKDL